MAKEASLARTVDRRFTTAWSAAEQHRVVELHCTGIERRLGQRNVDFLADVSVDADVPEEGQP